MKTRTKNAKGEALKKLWSKSSEFLFKLCYVFIHILIICKSFSPRERERREMKGKILSLVVCLLNFVFISPSSSLALLTQITTELWVNNEKLSRVARARWLMISWEWIAFNLFQVSAPSNFNKNNKNMNSQIKCFSPLFSFKSASRELFPHPLEVFLFFWQTASMRKRHQSQLAKRRLVSIMTTIYKVIKSLESRFVSVLFLVSSRNPPPPLQAPSMMTTNWTGSKLSSNFVWW